MSNDLKFVQDFYKRILKEFYFLQQDNKNINLKAYFSFLVEIVGLSCSSVLPTINVKSF